MDKVLSGKCDNRMVRRFLCYILIASVFISQLNVNCVIVQAKEKDYVKIIAVSPNYYRSYTTEMTFTATIEYNLESCDHGIVYLGFNTDEPHKYHIYAEQEVDQGSGTVTLQATVTPVDWGSYWKAGQHFLDFFKGYSSMETDFKIYANLSEYPHDDPWDPLATYDYPLEYMTKEAEQIEPELFWDKTNGHNGENKDQNFENPDAEAAAVYEQVKFDSSLEELCSLTASTNYNPQLAYMLMTLASGAYYKQCTIKNYKALGFAEGDYETYNYYYKADDSRYKPDSVAYCIGEKMTWDGRRMVLIVVRGSYDDTSKPNDDTSKPNDDTSKPMSPDWKSNFNLGEAETGISWHEGFETAANEVFGKLKSLYGDKLPTDNTFYVVTGHSRGAAVANLLSVLLSDNGVPKLNVYDYNFACPDVARNIGVSWNWLGDHDNIFNIGNVADPVTWIPGFLGDLLGNASDTGVSVYSLLQNKDLNISGSESTNVAMPLTDWGKFGRSYWFSENWEQIDKDGIRFDLHDKAQYMSYFKEHSKDSAAFDEMVTWEGVTQRSTIGKLLLTGLVLLVLCPVDVTVYDADGNMIASVVDGEIDYHESTFGNVVILTEGDHKLIYIKDEKEADVELEGTDDGILNYAVAEADILTGEIDSAQVYENIEISGGKHLSDHVVFDKGQEEEKLSSQLKVVNRWGNDISEVQADGQEVAVKGSFLAKFTDQIWLMILLAVIFLALIVLAIRLVMRRKGSRKNSVNMHAPDFSSPANMSGGMPSDMSEGMQSGDILCSCGTVNPPGVRTCMGCGKKLKRRR